MAYTTLELVASEFKQITFSSTTKITDTEVGLFITQSDAYINGRIGLLYETPVTGSESLEILKQISTGLVAQRIAKILETKSIVPVGDQAIPKELINEAKEMLQMIVDRKLLLSDATERSADAGVQSYSSSNTVTRKFDQSKQQW